MLALPHYAHQMRDNEILEILQSGQTQMHLPESFAINYQALSGMSLKNVDHMRVAQYIIRDLDLFIEDRKRAFKIAAYAQV